MNTHYEFKNQCIRDKIYNYLDLLDNNLLDYINELLLFNQINNIKIIFYNKYSNHPIKYFFNQNNNQLRSTNLYLSEKKIKTHYMIKMVRLKNILNLNHIVSSRHYYKLETCICGTISCIHNYSNNTFFNKKKHNRKLLTNINEEKFVNNLQDKKNQYFYCDICNLYDYNRIGFIKYNSRYSHIKSKKHKISEIMYNKNISFNDAEYEFNLIH